MFRNNTKNPTIGVLNAKMVTKLVYAIMGVVEKFITHTVLMRMNLYLKKEKDLGLWMTLLHHFFTLKELQRIKHKLAMTCGTKDQTLIHANDATNVAKIHMEKAMSHEKKTSSNNMVCSVTMESYQPSRGNMNMAESRLPSFSSFA
ncbi:hypothetical protein TanjilG_14187 [Lupinus angustifolius]|uniref:Uncharacterized protein n=1 Tax=Lupinus angustifolius TaxID=3871 RepID=A0A1J7HKA6_LUPAN|nr:hypothetical protein TanjilG_14187 [Lupinus angustifolius]